MSNLLERMSISTRLILVLLVLFILSGTTVVLLLNHRIRAEALPEAEATARILLDHNLAIHTYFSQQLKPGLFKWSDPFRSKDYFEPTWMSSTYAVRQICNYFKSLGTNEYSYKECAINARSPLNEADDFEKGFIEDLNKNPDLTRRALVREIDGKPFFVLLRRGETMEESCLRCHSQPELAPPGLLTSYGSDRSFRRRLGDVVSAISIRVPLAAEFSKADRLSLELIIGLLVFLVILLIMHYWLYRRFLLNPLRIIQKQATLISSSSNHLGEQIPLPAGREFHELTKAFNEMSLKLRQHHDFQENTVAERTAAFVQANENLRMEITERERIEADLRNHLNFTQTLIDTIPLPIFYKDINGIYVGCNQIFESFLGVAKEDILGKTVYDLATRQQADLYHDKDRQLFDKPGIQIYETTVGTSDGQRRQVVFHKSTYLGQDQSVAGLVGIIVDVTEPMRIQQELQQREMLLKSMLDALPVGVWIIDAEGTVIDANPMAKQIWGGARYVGLEDYGQCKGWWPATGKPVAADEWAGIRAITRGETSINEEIEIECLDGTHKIILYSAIPIRNQDQEIGGAIIVNQDVTWLKQTEETLRRANRKLRAYSACNQEILRAADELTLLAQVCRIVIEVGEYPFAWAGYAEQDEGKTVKPVASAGNDQGYLTEFKAGWGTEELGSGPTGTAIRTCRPVVANDLNTDPSYDPWRAEAVSRGYRSSIALPLMADGRAFGALSIYSSQPHAFNDDEIKLLSDLMDNISYGIM
ncbi:MAG: DUF3365 domain-containing protein, partial [Deltaproteobacteria bacterium]|nr:DUF3365 domain-containing protein [Deltaproteobacteria bacterium]